MSALPSSPGLPATAEDALAFTPAQLTETLNGEPAHAALVLRALAGFGHADAQAVLGQWLIDGVHVPRDPQAALELFTRAAAQGNVTAINMVGRCHENGWGTPVDFFAASNWYRQAAQKGLDAAMYNYANLLQSGRGVPQDHATAVALYREAADLGHAKSMTKIGRYFEDGLVLEKDPEAAFFCYREAAQGGDFRGAFCYAGMLAQRGQHEEALQWLRKVVGGATRAYLLEAGTLLESSPDAAFRG
ncbi:MAG: tetratricopeptide repeat protein, partial [Burkholderiaceae bacterium]